jgi:hypothetical protein
VITVLNAHAVLTTGQVQRLLADKAARTALAAANQASRRADAEVVVARRAAALEKSAKIASISREKVVRKHCITKGHEQNRARLNGVTKQG